MNYNRNITEDVAQVASIAPAAAAAGTYLSGSVFLGTQRKVLATLHVGALGTSGTVIGSWVAAPTASGTYVAVPNTASATISAGAENIALNELRGETVVDQGLGPYVKFQVVVAGSTPTLFSADVKGANAHYASNSDNNTTITAIVVN